MSAKAQDLPEVEVAIVGAGFSGLACAYHLQTEANARGCALRIALFEPNALLGAGIAYASQTLQHVLNVPASRMSIDERDPEGFVRWLRGHAQPYDAQSFVPRGIYQRYLAEALASSVRSCTKDSQLLIIQESVQKIERSAQGYQLLSARDRVLVARHVILALGNSVGAESNAHEESLLSSPWDPAALVGAARSQAVAIIGSGLSAVDVVLALEKGAFQGHYSVFSRHAYLPQPHAEHVVDVQSANDAKACIQEASTLRQMLSRFRAALKTGISWYDLIEALRPVSQGLWAKLSQHDQQRFIRHLRPHWSAHRHRIPRESAALLAKLVACGRLQLISSHFIGVAEREAALWLKLKSGQRVKDLPREHGPFGAVFNCMGLSSDIRRSRSSLLEGLLAANLASFDQLHLGLRCTPSGQLRNHEGQPVPGIYTLGPLRRGELWETIAVREIRQQARELALRVLG